MEHRGKVIWQGRIEVSKIAWTYDPTNKIDLSEEVEALRIDYWKEKKQQFPQIYDGKILRLIKYEESDFTMTLNTGACTYSQFVTIVDHSISTTDFRDQFGIKMIVFDLSKSRIMVGQRTENTDYKPLFWTMPGGVLEEFDTQFNLEDAVLRELNEEVLLNYKILEFNLVALVGLQNGVGIQALFEIVTDIKSTKNPIPGNEEWVNESLKWISFSDIKKIGNDRILEGLIYVIDNYL